MSPENQMQIGKFKTNPKQLATIGIMIVVVLIIIWQLMGLFGGGSSTTTVPAAPTKPAATSKMNSMTTASPNGAAPSATSPSPNTMPPTTPSMTPSPAEEVAAPSDGTPKPAPVDSANATLLKLQKQTEEKYLAALNDLQMLKVQQAIAETNQAIATAKLTTVTAEKNITDLLTKPAENPYGAGQAPASAAPSMAGAPLPGMAPATPSALPSAGNPAVKVTAASVVPDAPYQVLSVSEQNGKWTAVLGLSGKMFSISVGDSLPDQSVVIGINRQGVILEKDKKSRKVSMASML